MSVADIVDPLVRAGLGSDLPVLVRCWDGSEIGPPGAPVRLTFTSPRALRRMLWAPNELGFARAYVSGDVLSEGDIMAGLAARGRVGDPAFGAGAVIDSARRRALDKERCGTGRRRTRAQTAAGEEAEGGEQDARGRRGRGGASGGGVGTAMPGYGCAGLDSRQLEFLRYGIVPGKVSPGVAALKAMLSGDR